MAERKWNSNEYVNRGNGTYTYVHGSTAPKKYDDDEIPMVLPRKRNNAAVPQKIEEAAPEEAPRKIIKKKTAEEKRREAIKRQAEENRKNQKGLSASFGFAFTAVISVCVFMIFSSFVNYISLNIESSGKAKLVSNLEKELSSITMENDNLEISINSSIDYDEIFRVATEELGMVYASKKQIISYEKTQSEYVEQYKDID